MKGFEVQIKQDQSFNFPGENKTGKVLSAHPLGCDVMFDVHGLCGIIGLSNRRMADTSPPPPPILRVYRGGLKYIQLT